MKKKIAVLEADFGNLGSIINALKHLKVEFSTVKSPSKLDSYSHLILPGVGSFNKASKRLKSFGWFEAIKGFANSSKPLLGICLGMQLMFENSEEDGFEDGLNLFSGECKKFSLNADYPLPHMGFNLVEHPNTKIWKGIPNPCPFYFVHNYRIKVGDKDNTIANSFYGEKFTSFIENKNLFGAQFHPEKSHNAGLKLLKNFIDLN